MTIKNLSDVRRLPRLGKISLGVKKITTEGKEYPSEVDFFVAPEKVQKVYGEKPKEFRIMFPVENEEVFFSQFYKRYTQSGLQCKGDGEKAMCWDEAGGLKEIPCPCDKLAAGECRQIGILQFLLPEVEGAGVWQVTTSSRNSIIDVNSGISFIRSICGRIRMIPLILKREEIQVQRIEKGKPKKGKHYTLKLDLADVSLRQLQEAAQIAPERVLLPPPDESKDDLFFPKNGFKPEEEAIEVEPEKPAEEEIENSEEERAAFEKAEFVKYGQELEFLLKEYQDLGGKIGPNQQTWIKGFATAEDAKKAIEFFKDKKTTLETKQGKKSKPAGIGGLF